MTQMLSRSGSVRTISVAEAKRHFADVLGAVKHQHERFIIERNGTPMAALVPLGDLDRRPEHSKGFLALVGAFAEDPELPAALDAAVASRAEQESRPAPDLA